MKKRTLFLQIILVIALSGVALGLNAAEARTLQDLRILNATRVPTERIQNVLGLKEGQIITEEEIEKAMSYLRKWSRFEKIEVQKDYQKGGLVLQITLEDSLLITNIDIQGHFPYLASRIRNVIGMRVGQIYHRDALIEEVKKVRRFFEREGYFDNYVRVDATFNE